MSRTGSRMKLISRALTCARQEFPDDALPGPHDDAQAEYDDERLLIAAREYVAAHEGVETHTGEEARRFEFFHVALTMGVPARTMEEAGGLVQAAINTLPPLLFASWTTTEIPPDEVAERQVT